MTDQAEIAYLDIEGPGGKRSMALPDGGVCRIGRGPDNTLVIADAGVSRRHALIDQNQSKYYLTDLGSLNGTVLNGGRIAGRVRLSDGDRIQIGPETITFRLPAAPGGYTMSAVVGASTRVLTVTQFITVLVADIRGYTGLTLRLGEDRLSQIMSTFFRDAGALLAEHGASAQKYIGDAVMALWTHGEQQPTAVDLLVVLDAAVRLFSAAASLHTRFELDEPIRIGAGINTGIGTVGNLGSVAAADYTALGDAVNKAFRLESATKLVNTDLLVGWMTYQCLKPGLQSAFQQFTVELKGYELPERVFAITAGALESLLLGSETIG